MSDERVDIEELGSPWYEEHLSRYVYAKDFFKGKHVLDIACGTGFGSEYIATQKPSYLYACDISDLAIKKTTEKLKNSSILFDVGLQDGTNLDFKDNIFDTIISIETIEHIEKDLEFLNELQRVLKPNGTLIISCPNGLITNPSQGKPENPYHVREDFPQDFQKKIQLYFEIKKALGQDIQSSYGVAPFLPSYKKSLLQGKQRFDALFWSICYRLPHVVRNAIFKWVKGHNFYPSINDYTFLEEDIERAHVQYYICQPIKTQ